MSYNPVTDFLGLWRNSGGQVSKLEMPGLDYVVQALARAGLVTVVVSATAPVANQSTTAWLQTAVPSYSAEGSLWLWDKATTAYLPATSKLLLEYLEACANRSGVSWHTTTGGAPANTVGNDGDYAIRTDGVGGIYGPKALGAWPASPLPGSTDEISQSALDNTFGAVPGSFIYRDPADWVALPPGADNTFLGMVGGVPFWDTLSALMDAVFSNARGSVLFRGAAGWAALAPSTDDLVLTTHGPGADPSWTGKSSEFSSGTSMVFRQTNAPTGWTKDVSLDNYGLRVVSGAVGVTPGNAFSSVFSQTVVGSTTLALGQIPAHGHDYTSPAPGFGTGTSPNYFSSATTPGFTGSQGGGGSHTHSINLSLAYTDVIIATKD